MTETDNLNPITVLVYFAAVAGISMFSVNPVLLALSLAGAILAFVIRNGARGGKSHIFYFLAFIFMSLINPLIYHNGKTVLFVLGNNPITLEALIYGVFSSAMIISVLYWFRSFSQIMTGDKLLYLFGSLSPKLALILSMTLRYIPLFGTQIKKVNMTQKSLGLYREDNAIDGIRGALRVFSVMVSWTLENGIVTSDSMTSRGYGSGKRTFFSLYRFRIRDFIFISATLLLLAGTLVGMSAGALDFSYYPQITQIRISALSLLSYVSYGVLALLPSVLKISEDIKWKYLQSKI